MTFFTSWDVAYARIEPPTHNYKSAKWDLRPSLHLPLPERGHDKSHPSTHRGGVGRRSVPHWGVKERVKGNGGGRGAGGMSDDARKARIHDDVQKEPPSIHRSNRQHRTEDPNRETYRKEPITSSDETESYETYRKSGAHRVSRNRVNRRANLFRPFRYLFNNCG